LQAHLYLNSIKRNSIVDLAVSNEVGLCQFSQGASRYSGKISEQGGLTVRTATIDGLLSGGMLIPPHVIKMDVEGTEYAALEGALETIKQYKPIVMLATHSSELKIQCQSFLGDLGYVFSPDQWSSS
jgi:FkbM family methyltransferase